MAADVPAKKRSGDACECGNGHYRAYSSRNVGEYQIRYIECVQCGSRCRSVVKSHEVVRRKQR